MTPFTARPSSILRMSSVNRSSSTPSVFRQDCSTKIGSTPYGQTSILTNSFIPNAELRKSTRQSVTERRAFRSSANCSSATALRRSRSSLFDSKRRCLARRAVRSWTKRPY